MEVAGLARKQPCTKVGGPNKAHTLETNAYKIQFHKD